MTIHSGRRTHGARLDSHILPLRVKVRLISSDGHVSYFLLFSRDELHVVVVRRHAVQPWALEQCRKRRENGSIVVEDDQK
jgi:hypothetical protein